MRGIQYVKTSVKAMICLAILAVSLGANCFPVTGPTPQPPDDPGIALTASASASPSSVFQSNTTMLSASAQGGVEPFVFRWDQNAGPDLELGQITTAQFTTPSLDVTGQYAFRVVVTDSDGMTDEAFVTVNVGTIGSTSVPSLAVIGEPAPISVELTEEIDGAVIEWLVTGGMGSVEDPSSSAASITTEAPETVVLQLNVTIPGDMSDDQVVSQTFEIASAASLTPRVLFETTMGDFTLELRGEAAPNHTANMLLYVDDGFYDGLLIHRVACTRDASSGICVPFVIQGGGYERVDGELQIKDPTRDPVESEAADSLTNGDVYSVALALSGGDPNSGTTQIFVNMQDNSFLDDQGFTAFAAVVSGTDTIDGISAVEVTDSTILLGEESQPVDDITISRVTRVAP